MCGGLLQFEEVDEAGHGEDAADVIVHAADEDMAAFGLRHLQHAEEEAQSTGGDVVQGCAVEDDVLALASFQGLQVFLCLYGSGGVQSAFEDGNELAVAFLNCCSHNLMIIYDWA